MSARHLAALRRRLAGPLALVALLGGVLPGVLHRDGLHGASAAAVESVVSGCEQQHPPRFEPTLSSHRIDCPGCLLQLQRGVPAMDVAVAAAPAVLGSRPVSAPALAPASRAGRLPAPRGPPSSSRA